MPPLQDVGQFPFSSLQYLEGVASKPGFDPDLADALRRLSKDLSDFAQTLYGIRRGPDGSLLIYNKPFNNKIGDQLIIRINPDGQISHLQDEPQFSYAIHDAFGHIFAIPPFVRYTNTVNIAGVGLYAWPNATTNEPDMFVRSIGNTRITITNRGIYRVNAELHAENAAGAGTEVNVVTLMNGVAAVRQQSFGPVLAGAQAITHHIFWQQDFLAGDYVECNLVVGATRISLIPANSRLHITRVN